jgi:small ligand-binding sensory domain FIST
LIRAGCGISTHLDPRKAVAEATARAQAVAGLDSPEFALVLATAAHGDGLRSVADHSIELLPSAAVLGSSVEGVIACGLEVQCNPAVVVLLLHGCDVEPFLLPDLGTDPAGAGPELSAHFGGPLAEDDLVVVLPDPLSIHPDGMLSSLAEYLGPARVVGGSAAALGASGSFAWLGELQAFAGLAGFALRSCRDATLAVTQACHPVTPPLRVTRSRGNWIYGLDGRPALDVYREAAKGPLAEDLRHASRFLMASIPCDDAYDAPAYDAPGRVTSNLDARVRHIVGFDRSRAAISLPQAVPSGSSIWFSLLDSAAARDDLGETLSAGPPDPSFGLYFNCRARGESLFGLEGLEAGYIERRYGDTPIVGMFGAFQIAPAPGRRALDGSPSQLLTYAGVLSLFRA